MLQRTVLISLYGNDSLQGSEKIVKNRMQTCFNKMQAYKELVKMQEINIQRVMSNLEEIYQCGKKENGECDRLAFSPEDVKGRKTFISYFEAMGIHPKMDAAGNIIARIEGTDPSLACIAMGSHLDTVPNGGKYDGVLGCVGALEVCRVLKESGETLRHPLEVIVFTDEEGARFGSSMVGSSSICGLSGEFHEDDVDLFGLRREEVFQAYGIHTASLKDAERPADSIRSFLELHVEQGISLYREGKSVGIVSSIAGVTRYEVTLEGQANHAGSTLMGDRKDALVAAADFIRQVPDIVAQWGEKYTVATVGAIRVEPGAVNVVPGKCIFSLEIRDQDDAVMTRIFEKLKGCLEEIAARGNYQLGFRQVSYHAPAPMAEEVKNAIRKACEKEGCPGIELPSGAFHDSLLMTARFPTGMIFIPSVDGISHSPKEFSREEDIEKGCKVLLKTVLELDRSLD